MLVNYMEEIVSRYLDKVLKYPEYASICKCAVSYTHLDVYKRQGYIADKVVEIAEKNGVPVYRDDSLSVILSQLKIGSEIPEELFSSIVDIYVYFLNFKMPESEA